MGPKIFHSHQIPWKYWCCSSGNSTLRKKWLRKIQWKFLLSNFSKIILYIRTWLVVPRMDWRFRYSSQRGGCFQNPQGPYTASSGDFRVCLSPLSLGYLLIAETIFLSLAGRVQKHVFRFQDQQNKTQKELIPLLPAKVRFTSLHFLPWGPPFPGFIDGFKIAMPLLGHPDQTHESVTPTAQSYQKTIIPHP